MDQLHNYKVKPMIVPLNLIYLMLGLNRIKWLKEESLSAT